MPLAPDRELVQISHQAYRHMKKIIGAYKRKGIPRSGTRWLSELILEQEVPTNGNHKPPCEESVVPAPVPAPVHEEEK
jgi:hypothetical protein